MAPALSRGQRDSTTVYSELYSATEGSRLSAQFDLYDRDGVWMYSTGSGPVEPVMPTQWGVLYAARQSVGLAFTQVAVSYTHLDVYKRQVVACDQYTSQPEYWQRVEERVGRAPSSLRLILPESCLDGPSVETDIMEINNTMSRYLREERFALLPQTMIYVERTLHNGKLRRGLVLSLIHI